MDDDLEHHHFDDSPVDWMRAIAAALVTHTQLSEAAANSLSEAFPGVQELRLVLANGEQEVLECFSLIEGGEPNRRPLVCSFVLPPGEGSAAYEAMRLQSVIELDEATPDKDNLADWQYLVARHGIDWMLAAPLACKDSCAALSLVGAVLAGGVGAQPALSHAWLQEWSAEMAKTLAHASVQLMETSLDMLHAIFPPPALAQLLYNAVQSDQPSQAAALALVSAGAAGTAGNPLALRPGSQLAEGYSQLVFGSNPSTPQGLRTGSSQLLEDAQTSPFAALVAANNGELAPQSPLASLEMLPGGVSDARFNSLRLSAESLSSSQQGGAGGGPGSAGGSTNLAGAAFNPFSAGGWGPVTASGGAGDPRRSPSVASHCSMARQASIASSAAAALLRQASLQSDTSFLFEDADSSKVMSPHGSEVAGFEDLLREDMAAHIQRRASADFAAQTPPQGSGMQHDSATSMDWLQAQRSNPPSPPPLGLPQGSPAGSPPPAGAAALASARRAPGQAAASAQAVSPRGAQQGAQREGRESSPAVTAAAVAERLRPHKHQPQPQPATAPVSGAGSGATTSGAADSPILSPRPTSAPSRFSQQAQRDAQQAQRAPRHQQQQGQEPGKMSPTSWGPPLEQLPADSLGASGSGRTLLLTPGLGSVAVAAAVAKMKEHAEKVAAAEGAGPGADCPASQDSFTPFADFKPGGEQPGDWGSQAGDSSGGEARSAGASPDPGQSPQGSPHAGTDSSNPGSRGSARQARQSASGGGSANGRSVSPSKASLRAEQQAQPQQLRPPVAGFGPRLAHRLEAIVEGSSSVESSGRLSSSPLPSFGSLITGSPLGAPGQGNGNGNPPQARLPSVVEGPTSGEEASSPRTSSQRSSAEHPAGDGPPATAAAAAAAARTADVSQAPVGVPRHARDPGLQFQPLPTAAKPSSAPQLRQQAQPSRAPRGRSSGSRNGGTSSSSRARSDGKLPSSSSSASAAPADVQQRWDLTFADPEREAGYRAWAASRALAHDRLMGWTYAVVGAATLLGLLCRGMASRELLALHVIGSALYLLPGLAANISPRLWSAQRNYWLAGSRLVSMALYAAQLATTCSAEGPAVLGLLGESPTLCLLWRTGVSCMLMGALRLLLPLTIHVPVQLLSLWISTATLGLLSGHSSYTDCDDTDLPSALTLQGLLGFALPTLLVYLREARERQLFLGGKGRKE